MKGVVYNQENPYSGGGIEVGGGGKRRGGMGDDHDCVHNEFSNKFAKNVYCNGKTLDFLNRFSGKTCRVD